jgi:hypothetical protein
MLSAPLQIQWESLAFRCHEHELLLGHASVMSQFVFISLQSSSIVVVIACPFSIYIYPSICPSVHPSVHPPVSVRVIACAPVIIRRSPIKKIPGL